MKKIILVLALLITSITCCFAQQTIFAVQATYPLDISQGGTNALTAAQARNNLDIYSKGEVDSAIASAGGGTNYDVTTPIVVQKASIGTTTAGLAGEIITPSLIINASGAVQTRGTGTGSAVGNSRGSGATDLQNYRTLSSEISGGGCSVISGGGKNTITTGADWSTIAGGYLGYIGSARSTIGGGEENNIGVGAIDSTISGGYRGTISGTGYCSILGGYDNDILTTIYSNVGGGYQNKIDSSAYSSIVGGYQNQAKTHPYQFIGGGQSNISEGTGTAILSGYQNSASAPWSVVAGGYNNKISSVEASSSAIIGGTDNYFHSTNTGNKESSVIVGGQSNYMNYTTTYSLIGGGKENRIRGLGSVIVGGRSNYFENSNYGFIGAGEGNGITSPYQYSSVIGGIYNTISHNNSTALSGERNTLTHEFSTSIGGAYGGTSRPGEIVYGYGSFTGASDRNLAKSSQFGAKGLSTDTTPIPLHFYRSSNRFDIASGAVVTGDIQVVGVASNSLRSSYSALFKFKASRVNSTITISTGTTDIFADVGLEDCSTTIKEDNANGVFFVEVVGSSTTSIRWAATVRATEVRWP